MPDSVLQAGDTAVNLNRQKSLPHGAFIPVGEEMSDRPQKKNYNKQENNMLESYKCYGKK